MTNKEYFAKVDKVLRDAIATMNFNKAAADETEQEILKKNVYSTKHITEVLYPKRTGHISAMESAREAALAEINRLSAEKMEEITAANRITGEKLTDDAKLFGAGVALNALDIEAIFDRNRGNPTMEQLAYKYAEQHNIRINRTPRKIGQAAYDMAAGMPQVAKYILKNYNVPSFYEQFMGESGSVRQGMMNENDV